MEPSNCSHPISSLWVGLLTNEHQINTHVRGWVGTHPQVVIVSCVAVCCRVVWCIAVCCSVGVGEGEDVGVAVGGGGGVGVGACVWSSTLCMHPGFVSANNIMCVSMSLCLCVFASVSLSVSEGGGLKKKGTHTKCVPV